MTHPNLCPTTTELRSLLRADPSADELPPEMSAHLGDCTDCQAALEAIASQGRPVEELVPAAPVLPGIDETSAFWPAVRDLESSLQRSLHDTPTSGASSLPTPRPMPTATPHGPKSPSTATDRSSETRTPRPRKIDTSDLKLDFLDPPSDPRYLGSLDRFQMESIVGRGGMGLVFRAFDACLERTVAVKVLDPQTAKNLQAQERFCREARAAARIMHENVVTIHHVEYIESKDVSYIVMQFVNGVSLQERLDAEQRLSVHELVRISRQIASGLAAAHEQRLIHRDIKPGNVLLEGASGRVLLTDFGLARAAERDERLTQTGFVAGTPLFMSPEQASGNELDARTDLFSLGGVMYAMATGRPPFEGSSPYLVLRKVSESRHRPIQEFNPTLPEELVEMIDRLLSKDPARRIQTAEEVVTLLSGIEAKLPRVVEPSQPVTAQPSRLLPRWRRGWWGRHGGFIGATVLGLNLLLLTSELMHWTRWTVLGQGGGARLSPPATDPGPEPKLTLAGEGGPIWAVHFSPKDQLLAIGMDDGRVKIWDTQRRRLVKDFQAHKGPVWTLRYCSDGKRLATASDDGIFKVWSIDDFKLLQEEDNGTPIRVLAFSPDGTRLATGSRRGEVKVWDLESLNAVFVGHGHEGTVIGLDFSPDGERLASGAGDRTVKIWDLKSRQELTTLKGHQGGVYSVAFQPGGKLVASASWDRTIRLWEVETGSPTRVIEGHGEDIWSLAFSPDGQELISGGEDRVVHLWDVSKGEELRTFKGHQGTIYSVSFSADGKWIASGSRDGKLRLWER